MLAAQPGLGLPIAAPRVRGDQRGCVAGGGERKGEGEGEGRGRGRGRGRGGGESSTRCMHQKEMEGVTCPSLLSE